MADISSNLPVVDTSDGAPGSAVPSIAQQVAGTDGTNLRTLSVDTTGRQNIKLNDGTNTVAIRGASSAAVASDPALVVSISPNTPISSKVPLTASAPTAASVGTSSGVVIAANANRKGLILTNTSSLATVSFHLANGTAVLNSGITLYPHDSWVMDEYTFTTAAINGIASVASTNVAIQELIT